MCSRSRYRNWQRPVTLQRQTGGVTTELPHLPQSSQGRLSFWLQSRGSCDLRGHWNGGNGEEEGSGGAVKRSSCSPLLLSCSVELFSAGEGPHLPWRKNSLKWPRWQSRQGVYEKYNTRGVVPWQACRVGHTLQGKPRLLVFQDLDEGDSLFPSPVIALSIISYLGFHQVPSWIFPETKPTRVCVSKPRYLRYCNDNTKKPRLLDDVLRPLLCTCQSGKSSWPQNWGPYGGLFCLSPSQDPLS